MAEKVLDSGRADVYVENANNTFFYLTTGAVYLGGMYLYYSTNFQRHRSKLRFTGFALINTFIATAYSGIIHKTPLETAQKKNYIEEASFFSPGIRQSSKIPSCRLNPFPSG